MENYGKWPALFAHQRTQLPNDQVLSISGQPLGLVAPVLVTHVVDVAVATIEIAPASDLQQNRIDVHLATPKLYRLCRLNVRL